MEAAAAGGGMRGPPGHLTRHLKGAHPRRCPRGVERPSVAHAGGSVHSGEATCAHGRSYLPAAWAQPVFCARDVCHNLRRRVLIEGQSGVVQLGFVTVLRPLERERC